MIIKIITTSIIFLISFLFVYSIFGFMTLATDIWLVFLVYLIAFSTFKASLGYTITLSYLLSLLSSAPFGTHFFIYFVVLLVIHYLSENVLTHQSLNSFLLLNIIAIALFYFLTFITSSFYLLIGVNTYLMHSLSTITAQIVINLTLSILVFMLTTFFGNRLRLNILQTTKL